MLFQKHFRSRTGFTLVELIVVIMIIGILAATMLPKIMGVPARARDSQRISDLGTISTALEIYFVDNDAYPAGVTTVLFKTPLETGYLDTLPQDPKSTASTGLHYVYCVGESTDANVPDQRYALAVRVEKDGSIRRGALDAADNDGKFTYVVGTDSSLIVAATLTNPASCVSENGTTGGPIVY